MLVNDDDGGIRKAMGGVYLVLSHQRIRHWQRSRTETILYCFVFQFCSASAHLLTQNSKHLTPLLRVPPIIVACFEQVSFDQKKIYWY